MIRIHAANRIAAAEVAVSRDDLKKAENQVALQVHTLYFGILIARLQKQAAEQQSAYAGENLRESEEDVRNGSALKVAAIQGRAGLLESQQAVLTADLQLSDLTTELNDLLGLPLDTQLELDPAVPANFDQRPREEYVQTAWSENPEILAAEEAVRKAQAGVTAAKSAYIPDITAYARHSYQDGVPFLVRNFGTFGVNLNWDVFDFGKRRAAVREREAQLAQAEENLRRLKEEVAVGDRAKLQQAGADQESGPSSKPGSEAAAGERAVGTEPIDPGRSVGVRTAAGHGRHLQGSGGLSSGEPGISACLGGTRASCRPHPRILAGANASRREKQRHRIERSLLFAYPRR